MTRNGKVVLYYSGKTCLGILASVFSRVGPRRSCSHLSTPSLHLTLIPRIFLRDAWGTILGLYITMIL